LQDYLAKYGGKDAILQAFEDKKAGKPSKKRGRASTGATAENGAKRGRKSNGTHPASATPPRGADFKPPTGNWEDEVVQIDACEGAEGSVVVYLTWKGGQKSQHPLAQVYKRCPQKVRIKVTNSLIVLLTEMLDAKVLREPFVSLLSHFLAIGLSNTVAGYSRKRTTLKRAERPVNS